MSRRTARRHAAPRITACLIVRDEEANLARSLPALQQAVDEIIVVDTGSRDRSADVAAKHGARVFHFAWCDDFAAARNESLRHATGDWLMYVDADEELRERTPGELRRLCTSIAPSVDARCIIVRSPSDTNGVGETIAAQCRLFRNGRGLRFAGRVHEQVVAADGKPLVTASSEGDQLELFHWGYVPEGNLLARKGTRNRHLLELSMVAEPDEPLHVFNMGRQMAWEQDYAAALPILQRAIAMWTERGRPDGGYVPSMFSTAALAAMKTPDYDEVLRIYGQTPAELVSSELLYVAGCACCQTGNLAMAVSLLERACTDESLAKATGVDPATATWRPLVVLGEIFEKTGVPDKARAAYKRAARYVRLPAIDEALARLSQPAPVGVPGAGGTTVSACMIVRNEATNLVRLLPRLRQAVDEIIVVDTGSEDGTAAIAEQYGARVFRFDWCDDFAAARNESLRHATSEWMMWIDADDELVEAESEALRRACAALGNAAAGIVRVDSLAGGNGQVGTVLRQPRLLRNRVGIRFEGRVHEQPVLPAGGKTGDAAADVLIRHLGYAVGAELLNQKAKRNQRLLELMIAEDTRDPLLHYSLGKQYVWLHEFQPGLESLQRAIQQWTEHGRPSQAYVAPLFAVSVCCALNLGDNELALKLEAQCPPEDVSSDLLYYAAIACQRSGQSDGAMRRLQRAIQDPTVRNASETDPATSSWRSAMLLSQIHAGRGNHDLAYEMSRQAMETMPATSDVLLGWARLAYSKGDNAEAVAAARRALESATDDSVRQTASQLLRQIEGAIAPRPEAVPA